MEIEIEMERNVKLKTEKELKRDVENVEVIPARDMKRTKNNKRKGNK